LLLFPSTRSWCITNKNLLKREMDNNHDQEYTADASYFIKQHQTRTKRIISSWCQAIVFLKMLC
jgi:hypothetical protein